MKISKKEFDFWLQYCREISLQYNVVRLAVKSARYNRMKDRKNALDAMGVTPDQGRELGPVPVVQCVVGADTFVVVWPEGWLDAIDNALELVAVVFGDNVRAALEGVYFEKHTRLVACADNNVNYQVFSAVYDKQFILYLTVLAAHANLLPAMPQKN